MFDAAATEAYFLTGTWEHQTYKGVPIFKFPTDLWLYHEVIWEMKPDTIIELGAAFGGSARWFADCQQAAGVDPHVWTLDLAPFWNQYGKHPGVVYHVGSSLDPDVVGHAHTDGLVMVTLDTDHTTEQVSGELALWARLADILVVEDTFLGYMESDEALGPFSRANNPRVALEAWDSSGFERQPDWYSITMNPGGWFYRV